MDSVIIDHNAKHISDENRREYQQFILCLGGSCRFVFNEQTFEMKEGTCTVILSNRFLGSVEPSNDFKCQILSAEEGFLRQSIPNHPYIVQGMLSFYKHPVMELTEEEFKQCRKHCQHIQKRAENKAYTFYEDMLRTMVRMFLLDLYDMHARMHKSESLSKSAASIMSKFIDMLQEKEYRNNREVAYYAEKLCVVPKYLSEVSNKISGFSASYWINRYTAHDIHEILNKNKNTPAEIAKMFHFTSTSYFNRYVKRYLGAYPSELRQN